jgi:antitoxin component of MazEF toxin-antitoxin module
MQKKLSRTGNSLALILDKALLERTRIDENTPLEVTDDGEVIIISKVRDKRRERKLGAAVADAHRRYGAVFRNLAK